MAYKPQYIGTPKSPTVSISAANTGRDGTGTLGTLMTAGALGARVDHVIISATSNTTAGMIRFFVGTSLVKEIPVVPVTASATVPAWSYDLVFDNGLILQANALLKVSTNNAEAFVVTVISGGDF